MKCAMNNKRNKRKYRTVNKKKHTVWLKKYTTNKFNQHMQQFSARQKQKHKQKKNKPRILINLCTSIGERFNAAWRLQSDFN